MTSKTIKLKNNEQKCDEVVLLLYRDDEGIDGVLITGWYKEEDEYLIATKFIEMSTDDGLSFIRDYSNISAEDFIYNVTN